MDAGIAEGNKNRMQGKHGANRSLTEGKIEVQRNVRGTNKYNRTIYRSGSDYEMGKQKTRVRETRAERQINMP